MLNAAEERALEALEKHKDSGDPEAAHGAADGILLRFVRELGYEAVADAWEAIDPKWYA